MSMPKDLLTAIEGVLPAIQVKTLTDQLNELESLRKDKESLKSRLEYKSTELADTESTLATVRATVTELTNQLREAKTTIEALSIKERDAEIAGLRAALRATEETTNKFLKNTIYRESLQHTILQETPNIQYQNQGGYNNPVSVGVNKTPISVTDVKEQTTE